MRIRHRLISAGVTLTILLCQAARAQQPFVTDDADATKKGKLHFEFSNQLDLLQRAQFPNLKQNTADFELDYGLFERVEIGIESPLIAIFNARGASPRTAFGIGDTNLSVKYNFRKERPRSWVPAMAASLSLELPTGDTRRQLGSGLTDYFINMIFQKTIIADMTLRFNGGILFAGNTTTGVVGIKTRGRVHTGGVSLVRQFSEKLNLGVEVTGAVANNIELSGGQLQFQAGGNYALGKNLSLDFGVTGGRYSASPRLGAQLGVSVDF